MSKAEKFISDCTRNCSNQSKWGVETPNKSIIYVQPWLTPDQARKAAEIAREEIYDWLENNLSAYDACDSSTERYRLLKELKQAMKDD